MIISWHTYVPQFLLGNLWSDNTISNGNIGKTTTLHFQHTFLYILLKFLPDYDVILLTFMTIMEDVSKQQQNFSLFLNLDMVPRNSTPGGFAYTWQSNWVGIFAIKTKRMQIHMMFSLPSYPWILRSLLSLLRYVCMKLCSAIFPLYGKTSWTQKCSLTWVFYKFRPKLPRKLCCAWNVQSANTGNR